MNRKFSATARLTTIRWLAACSLISLIGLSLSWELWLAPLRPGGSALVYKALPLLLPLFGVLHGKRYTYQWSSMLILFYFTEGVVRAWSERPPASWLASAEIVLSLVYFVAALLYSRLSRREPAGLISPASLPENKRNPR